MTSTEHLLPYIREKLSLPEPERINYILQDRWIGYTRANELLAHMEFLLEHPKVGRMPNMLITGDSNNGKSHLVKQFCKKYCSSDNPDGDAIRVPILYVEAPDKPSLPHFYMSILDLLFVPHKANEKEGNLKAQVISVLKRIDLKVLIIDEMNNLLTGTPRSQRIFLNALKYLGNQLQLPIIGVGIPETKFALQVDPQLSNRFKPFSLDLWRRNNEFRKLLFTLERMIPLKSPSNLSEAFMADKLLAMSEGLIGELSTLLNMAAIWAIRNAKDGRPEAIDIEALDSCGYVPPSMRRDLPIR